MPTVKIDWVSLSAQVPLGDGPAEPVIHKACALVASVWPSERAGYANARLTGGRGAARWGLAWPADGVQLFAGDKSGWVALEFSGLGCNVLRECQALDMVLALDTWRITRLDLAIDIPGADPGEIAGSVDALRFKTRSSMQSVQGETHYIGSAKSDRMVRVYRYNLPHPRAGLCRVEFVLRNGAARKGAQAILDNGLASVGAELVRKFGFTSPALDGVGLAKPIHSYSTGERTRTGKYRWISGQAIPGIARAIKEGIVSRTEVLAALDRALQSQVDV